MLYSDLYRTSCIPTMLGATEFKNDSSAELIWGDKALTVLLLTSKL
jgi:hypothetical protein